MNEKSKNDENKDRKNSNKQFGILLKVCLVIGIIIISGFIIYYIFTFGILNENREAENYPTEVSVNETISFYLTVGNYLDREFNFRFKIKKGNNDTVMSSVMGSDGSLYLTLGNFTLEHNNEATFGYYNISFSEIGVNQIVIAELWQIKNEVEEFYNIIWLRLNITN